MTYELQNNFSAGELTPKAWLRNDIKGMYSAATKKMRNALADPHGVVSSRLGFDFIEELPGEEYCRLFDFDFSSSESVVVAVTPNYIHIIGKDGFTLGENLTENGHFSLGSSQWNEQRTLFSNGLAILQPGGNANQDAFIRQEITGMNIGEVHRINVTGFGSNGGSDFEIYFGSVEGGTDLGVVPGTGANFIYEFTPTVSSLWIQINIDGATANKTLDSVLLSEVSTLGAINFPSPYTDNDIFELQIEKEPGNRNMYFFTRDQAPMVLKHEDNVYSFAQVVFIFGTEGAPWGTDNPGCITFHDGRMAVGGTFSQPVHIWLSQPRNYTNFDMGDGSTDDLAMELPLDKHGELQWLRSNKKLFAGLDTGEHVIFGINGPLAPNNAQTEQHSSYGSSRAHAILVDERTVYIDKQRRTVRAMDYNDTTDGYVSEDISFQAEHISFGRLTELKFGISPFGAIWFPTFSGDLVGCSIEKSQGTIGWHRHDTQGQIISITTLKEFGVDVPWIAVRRNNRLYVERYSVDNLAYMDSALKITAPAPTLTFAGFDHLNGQTVQVIADGAVHPDVVILLDGIITLQYEATTVTAGLGFTAEVETLPMQNLQEDGNTMFHVKRWSDIAVYLLESARPIINGEDPYARSPETIMGEREGNETGVVEVSASEWDYDASIVVTQPLPLNMVILGIGGKVKENKL